jgi:uncharacterized membrane protein
VYERLALATSTGLPFLVLAFHVAMGVAALAAGYTAIAARKGGTWHRHTRHLWRMCFGLFIASGSFVAQLAMMKGMPAWMQSVPVMVVLAAGPLVVLLY